jgi:hypothetical protein
MSNTKLLVRRIYGDLRALARWANENGVQTLLRIDHHPANGITHGDVYDVLLQLPSDHPMWLTSDECRSLARHHDLSPRV